MFEAQSPNDAYKKMKQKLSRVVPDMELRIKAELVYEILQLKKERNATILGHNYMEPALFYTVPDIVGDSLMLSREAALTEKDPIIFCGVRFMAETAKILNPSKTVLLPAREAGCSLAASISAEDVLALRAAYPGVPIVAYVNTYAEVKAEVDVCCTSGNAHAIVRRLKSDTVIFLPDEYLAKNVAAELGYSCVVAEPDSAGRFPALHTTGKTIIAWPGRCEVHEQFRPEDIHNARAQFPDVSVVAHPECAPEVIQEADFTGSTTSMVNFVKRSPASRFLILTECSMGDNIIAENPEKEIVRLCSVRCPHMNQITLEDTIHALRHNETLIELDEELRKRAFTSVNRMIQ